MKLLLSAFTLLCLLFLNSCASSQPSYVGKRIDNKLMDNNPFGSAEIIGCAKSLVPEMLMSDALDLEDDDGESRLVRIAVKPLVNDSSVRLSTKMITNAIKQEFAKVASEAGYTKVRFVAYETKSIKDEVGKLSEAKRMKRLDKALDKAAEQLLQSPQILNAPMPAVIAILPSTTTNLVNLNANSFIKMLRAKIAEKANGRVNFTMEAGDMLNADYYLMGDFIAESMKTEGMVNLADYITLMEERVKEGKEADFLQHLPAMEHVTEKEYAKSTTTTLSYSQYRTLLGEVRDNQNLREPPNVDMLLNVMLIRPSDRVAVFEKSITMEKFDLLKNVDYILSGTLSSVSHQEANREEMIYVVADLHLVDENGDEVWSGSYDSKKLIPKSVVY